MACRLALAIVVLVVVGVQPAPQRERGNGLLASPLGALLSQIRGINEARGELLQTRGQLVQSILLPASLINRPFQGRVATKNTGTGDAGEEEPKDLPSNQQARPQHRGRPGGRRPNHPRRPQEEAPVADEAQGQPQEEPQANRARPGGRRPGKPEEGQIADESLAFDEPQGRPSNRARPAGRRPNKPKQPQNDGQVANNFDITEEPFVSPIQNDKNEPRVKPQKSNKPKQPQNDGQVADNFDITEEPFVSPIQNDENEPRVKPQKSKGEKNQKGSTERKGADPSNDGKKSTPPGGLPTVTGSALQPPGALPPMPTHSAHEDWSDVKKDEEDAGKPDDLIKSLIGAPCRGGVAHDNSCREEFDG